MIFGIAPRRTPTADYPDGSSASRSSSSRSTTAARPTTSERDTAGLRARAGAAVGRAAAASRTSRSRPPTTSPSPGAPLVHQGPATPTTSGRRRSTRWSSTSPPAPAGGSFSITALGGAIGRVDEDATAFAGRAARFDLSADSAWDDPADRRRERATGSGGRWRSSSRTRSMGRYANENARRRARRDARDLRRREARPPCRPQADLGPGQRLPR